MATQHEKGEKFRALHTEAMRLPRAFVMPNPWDGGSARILEGLGEPVYSTGLVVAVVTGCNGQICLAR